MTNLLYELWETGYVKRWHNKPYVKPQTTGQHTHGMCVLLMKLHPSPTADLYEAIIQHDGGEYDFLGCDFPYPQKRDFPVLRDIDDKFNDNYQSYFGLRKPILNEADRLWLSYLDQLEAAFYTSSLVSNDVRVQDCAAKCFASANHYKEQLQRLGYLLEDHETVQ